MEYNTTRSPLAIREYGRSIQSMINFASTIEDREKRNDVARSIIRVMSQLSPQDGNREEREQQLYDQLFVMSNFKLDIDSPYPIPTQETLHKKPKKVPYPTNGIRLKHYGRSLQRMIIKASEMPDGDERIALVKLLIIQMKRAYTLWNQNVLDEHLIAEQLRILSEGQITYTSDMYTDITPELPEIGNSTPKKKKKKKKKKNNNNNGSKF
ncbi:MAG: DUF4290 domain-containing protein [Bacteroidales bacterium]|jgi:hypothetical protein|nr:DUF4290 domain-containing protein [Bacteroidales bacterium]